ncbi:MAG: DUF6146 family protein [Bacteroidales bacterium]|nr:DUF6146 family protein [Bacteroidales bacterium]
MYKTIISIISIFITLNLFGFQNHPSLSENQSSDTLQISTNDSTGYDIIIIETGYENWMATNAKPKWFYTNEYYRNKNQFYVLCWNNRVLETMHSNPFEETIDFDPNIDYGLDVNYQLYWYFKFMESKYSINLSIPGKDR